MTGPLDGGSGILRLFASGPIQQTQCLTTYFYRKSLEPLISQTIQQLAIGLLTQVKAAEAEELVWGVCPFILQAKSKADGVRVEKLKKEPANGDAATSAMVDRFSAIKVLKNAAHGLVARMVSRDHIGLSKHG